MTLAAAGGFGGAWGDDGTIIYTNQGTGELFRVSADGGTPVQLTRPPADGVGNTAYFPSFLPDGGTFIYLRARTLYARSLDGTNEKLLLENVGNAKFASGHLLFLRERTLMTQPFDPRSLVLSGTAVPVADRILINDGSGAGAFTVSGTGLLLFQTTASKVSRLTWLDRTGRQVGTVGEPDEYGEASLAPDGQSVVASIYNRGANDRDIWLLDTRRGVRTRVTSGPEDDSDPLLSPDGLRLAYSSRNGFLKKLVIRSTGATNVSVLVEDTWNKYANTWTADGRSVLFSHFTGPRGFDISAATSGSSPVPVLATAASESRSRLSPDGRFIAYQSTESGRPEVYLATYPDGQQKWPVSSGGGADPEWGPDGSELYFVTPTALVQTRVVSRGGKLEIGAVEPLVDLRRPLPGLAALLPIPSNIFDVAPDGQRFLFNIPDQTGPEPATLLVNWPELIRRGK